MIRPGGYGDRGVFTDRDRVWRPKRGASDGVIEPVPEPWFDRFLLRWLPKSALSRAQARAELRRLELRAGGATRHGSHLELEPQDPAVGRGRPAAAVAVARAGGGERGSACNRHAKR
jgi:hypothetical protein